MSFFIFFSPLIDLNCIFFPTWICQEPTPPDFVGILIGISERQSYKKALYHFCFTLFTLPSPPPPSHSDISLSLLCIHGFHGYCLYFPAGSSSPNGLSLATSLENLESPPFLHLNWFLSRVVRSDYFLTDLDLVFLSFSTVDLIVETSL